MKETIVRLPGLFEKLYGNTQNSSSRPIPLLNINSKVKNVDSACNFSKSPEKHEAMVISLRARGNRFTSASNAFVPRFSLPCVAT